MTPQTPITIPPGRWTDWLSERQRELYLAVASEFQAHGAPLHQEEVCPWACVLSLIEEKRLAGAIKDVDEYTAMIRAWAAEIGLSGESTGRLLRKGVN